MIHARTATGPAPTKRESADLIDPPNHGPEVSIVMPCLNEADTIGTCIEKAMRALHDARIDGEIIIADNGSTDGSKEIAAALGARVIEISQRGYGNALIGGIDRAHGRFIIMGDADDSYDFGEIPKFVDRLRDGYELVQGCRLPSGGGTVKPGAMPILHRWWGNPAFSMMARCWFAAPIHDVYCGMRGFTRRLYDRLDLRSPGMEFATEMIIKASRYEAKIAEVPITLHPDGRKSHPPHLKTFRDGWRTLRFYLMHCPRWLFLEPGKLLIALGAIGYVVSLAGVQIASIGFGLNSLVMSSLAILCGQQAVLFAIGTKVVAISSRQCPPDQRVRKFFRVATLERGLVLGCVMLAIGLGLIAAIINTWKLGHFGALNPQITMRWVIPGATLTAAGLQTILSSFFISIIGTLNLEPRARQSASKEN
ncbi:MAG: glycosyltransferase family 2 protein [Anaerolineae bacterium]|nr:glycosyltransferase family 2 protein [Phycisphaerae bacterium]